EPRRPLVAAVSLDTRQQNAIERAKAFPTQWRTGFEPGGWESPTARRLGINALPTVWVLDAEGRLRSLNARGDWQSWVGRLAR
ncbi:MAG: hypothetical protein N2322_04400, partial [Terrimicrobiaceae bacterium]|nr:hypothetical protein [Terrimicrobiaceae bacterium]